MKKDIGKLKHTNGSWRVEPYGMTSGSIMLHPLDVRSFENGYCLSDPSGLDVCFELSYIKRKGRDYDMYARIISEAEYNIPLV